MAQWGDAMAHSEMWWLMGEIQCLIWRYGGSWGRYSGLFGDVVAPGGDVVAHSEMWWGSGELQWLIQKYDGSLLAHQT